MKRIVAIDIPWMALLGVGRDEHLLDTLDAMQNNGCFLLMNENLYDALPESFWKDELMMELIRDRLTRLQTLPYNLNIVSPYICHNPNMTDESFGEKINNEIKALCCVMHVDPKLEHVVLVMDREGWEAYENFITVKDKKEKQHMIIHASVQPFELWLQARQPKLIVKKHYTEEYKHGNIVVSSFKAGANIKYATDLLHRAYFEYEGMEEEPKYLYTYDVQNGCFVQFRGDRNWEYHGMDIENGTVTSCVPTNIRMKYHK